MANETSAQMPKQTNIKSFIFVNKATSVVVKTYGYVIITKQNDMRSLIFANKATSVVKTYDTRAILNQKQIEKQSIFVLS